MLIHEEKSWMAFPGDFSEESIFLNIYAYEEKQ